MTDYTKLEEDLNKIKYKGIGIGSLLALEFFNSYKDIYKKKGLKNYLVFIKIIGRSFLKKIPLFPDKFILYFKSGDKNHHNQIYGSFINLEKNIILIGGTKDTVINSFAFKTDYKEFIDQIKWSFKNYQKFKAILNKHLVKNNELSLFIDLQINLLRVNFWNDFLQSNRINILIGDYDRGNASVPIYLTSKKYQIPSIVLQHGAINSPYGFTPLIADHVFVWGKMQKTQFMDIGVNKERITITGTPMVIEIEKNKIKKNKKNIVLAVNPIKPEFIKQQIETFTKLSNFKRYNLFIKIHPAQTISNIKKLLVDKTITILPKNIKFADFVEMCDVLITHNSALANECILNDIPVIILDNLPISPGNGLELHKFCNIPIVNDAEALNKQIQNFNLLSINKKGLYFKSGEEAKEEIQKEALKIYNN